MEDDERELSRRLRRGDAEAFDVIFDRYSRPLLRIAWLKTGDYEAAADAVQETLLVLWRRRAEIPEQSMFPWLVGVLGLAIRNHVQTLRRHPTTPLGGADGCDASTMSVEQRDAVLDLVRSLERLTDLERQIVLSCAVEDLTYKEAGERLGLSSQAVAKRFQRLRVRLRRTVVGEEQA